MSGDKWSAKIANARRRAHDHDTLDCLDEFERMLKRAETRETVSGEIPESQKKPWESQGISRAAYYRRKRAEADRAGQ
jgi:hypothetical protein